MGKVFSCFQVAFEQTNKTREHRALEKVYDWLERIEKDSKEEDIRIQRKQFKAFMEYVMDELNGAEDRGKQSTGPMAYLINPLKSNAAMEFVDAFQEKLKEKGILLRQKPISATDKLDPSLYLILVCNAASDIEACFNTKKGEVLNKKILIFLHVVRRGKTPTVSTRKKLGDDFCSGRYSSIISIIDMAFTTEDGIYDCTMNEEALNEFENVYKQPKMKVSIKTTDVNTPRIEEMDTPSTENTSNDDEELTGPIAYLINPSKSNAATVFVEAFQENLKKKIILLRQDPISATDKLDPSLFLILVCNATSRIEPDIEECFNTIQGEVHNKIILIILHVARRGKTPTQGSTRRKLGNGFYSGRYSSIISIIDMAFTTEDGIYDCTMNEEAFTEFENVYKQLKRKYSIKMPDVHTQVDPPSTEDTSNNDECAEDTDSLLQKLKN